MKKKGKIAFSAGRKGGKTKAAKEIYDEVRQEEKQAPQETPVTLEQLKKKRDEILKTQTDTYNVNYIRAAKDIQEKLQDLVNDFEYDYKKIFLRKIAFILRNYRSRLSEIESQNTGKTDLDAVIEAAESQGTKIYGLNSLFDSYRDDINVDYYNIQRGGLWRKF